MTNVTWADSVRFSVCSFTVIMKRAFPRPPNKLSRFKTTCTYVNSTSHATVFNLQPCELCKDARLSTKFSHTGRRIICNKKDFVRWPRQGASHCKHIQISVVKYKCMPAKSTAQYNNWQPEKHLESQEELACFVTLSTGETVRRTHFSGYYAKRNGKQTKTKQNKNKK